MIDLFIKIDFLGILATLIGIRARFQMVGDNNARSSHAHDEAQYMEVLRASFLTQETILRALADSIDNRFWAFEGRFEKIAY